MIAIIMSILTLVSSVIFIIADAISIKHKIENKKKELYWR